MKRFAFSVVVTLLAVLSFNTVQAAQCFCIEWIIQPYEFIAWEYWSSSGDCSNPDAGLALGRHYQNDVLIDYHYRDAAGTYYYCTH
ncbi:hypothetical protein HGH92_30505 [Chitinophaga varians]|uniref:Uncharacterized protein n=1 Tax=Chitinophaga varians TaxID=2202339 RepID=A0A847S2N6_9BACT|nr:hypothetical protein [Chitinophaga varians]NLR68674.1 hypothetical protein [Chitinophaga varians]